MTSFHRVTERRLGIGRQVECSGVGGTILRRFGARGFVERLHRNRCVLDVYDLEVFGLFWRAQDDAVADARFHQRVGERRSPADAAAIKIHFVGADDVDDVFVAGSVVVRDRRAEKYPRRRRFRPRRRRIHDFGGVDAFGQEAQPRINLAQPALGLLVIGVLAAIAVARGPRDDLRHRRAFPVQQESIFVLQPLQPWRRDVVLRFRPRRLQHLRP